MTSPLISADELRAALASDDPPVVLDVRWRLGGPPGRDEHARGHVPAAIYVDLEEDLSGAPDPAAGRHPLPAPADFERTLRSWGVRQSGSVVAYDDVGGTSAARAWWLLRWVGYEAVRVLDGGLAAWVAAGGSLESGAVEPPGDGDVGVEPGALPALDADAAAALAREGVLLDARAIERYRGEVEPIDPVAGHIPGAASAPTTENLDAEGRFLSADRLRKRFADLGAAAGVPVGVYCGSGVTAAHELLALTIAGLDGVLYPASWSGWLSDPERPVATGAEPG
jgi:thiosulfate/3-mercaptopyruvate sulfurtransferase